MLQRLDRLGLRLSFCSNNDGPLLGPGPFAWNRDGMHHLDAHRLDDGTWFACVDGFTMQRQPAAETVPLLDAALAPSFAGLEPEVFEGQAVHD